MLSFSASRTVPFSHNAASLRDCFSYLWTHCDCGVILDSVRKGEGDWGFDAELGEYVHMFQQGIIDPVKVTRSALQNAASIAGMMLTTEAIVTEIPVHKPMPPELKDD